MVAKNTNEIAGGAREEAGPETEIGEKAPFIADCGARSAELGKEIRLLTSAARLRWMKVFRVQFSAGKEKGRRGPMGRKRASRVVLGGLRKVQRMEEGNSKAAEGCRTPCPGGNVDASEVSSFQCSVFSGKEETAGLTGVPPPVLRTQPRSKGLRMKSQVSLLTSAATKRLGAEVRLLTSAATRKNRLWRGPEAVSDAGVLG